MVSWHIPVFLRGGGGRILSDFRQLKAPKCNLNVIFSINKKSNFYLFRVNKAILIVLWSEINNCIEKKKKIRNIGIHTIYIKTNYNDLYCKQG